MSALSRFLLTYWRTDDEEESVEILAHSYEQAQFLVEQLYGLEKIILLEQSVCHCM